MSSDCYTPRESELQPPMMVEEQRDENDHDDHHQRVDRRHIVLMVDDYDQRAGGVQDDQMEHSYGGLVFPPCTKNRYDSEIWLENGEGMSTVREQVECPATRAIEMTEFPLLSALPTPEWHSVLPIMHKVLKFCYPMVLLRLRRVCSTWKNFVAHELLKHVMSMSRCRTPACSRWRHRWEFKQITTLCGFEFHQASAVSARRAVESSKDQTPCTELKKARLRAKGNLLRRQLPDSSASSSSSSSDLEEGWNQFSESSNAGSPPETDSEEEDDSLPASSPSGFGFDDSATSSSTSEENKGEKRRGRQRKRTTLCSTCGVTCAHHGVARNPMKRVFHDIHIRTQKLAVATERRTFVQQLVVFTRLLPFIIPPLLTCIITIALSLPQAFWKPLGETSATSTATLNSLLIPGIIGVIDYCFVRRMWHRSTAATYYEELMNWKSNSVGPYPAALLCFSLASFLSLTWTDYEQWKVILGQDAMVAGSCVPIPTRDGQTNNGSVFPAEDARFFYRNLTEGNHTANGDVNNFTINDDVNDDTDYKSGGYPPYVILENIDDWAIDNNTYIDERLSFLNWTKVDSNWAWKHSREHELFAWLVPAREKIEAPDDNEEDNTTTTINRTKTVSLRQDDEEDGDLVGATNPHPPPFLNTTFYKTCPPGQYRLLRIPILASALLRNTAWYSSGSRKSSSSSMDGTSHPTKNVHLRSVVPDWNHADIVKRYFSWMNHPLWTKHRLPLLSESSGPFNFESVEVRFIVAGVILGVMYLLACVSMCLRGLREVWRIRKDYPTKDHQRRLGAYESFLCSIVEETAMPEDPLRE